MTSRRRRRSSAPSSGFFHLAIAAGAGVGAADLVLVLGARSGLLTGGRGACVNVMTDGLVIAPILLAMVGTLNPKDEDASQEVPKDESIRIPYYEDLKE